VGVGGWVWGGGGGGGGGGGREGGGPQKNWEIVSVSVKNGLLEKKFSLAPQPNYLFL